MAACRGAFLLSCFGFKSVTILNGKFQSWNNKSKSEIKYLPANGKNFDFKLNTECFATPEEVREIAEGRSSV